MIIIKHANDINNNTVIFIDPLLIGTKAKKRGRYYEIFHKMKNLNKNFIKNFFLIYIFIHTVMPVTNHAPLRFLEKMSKKKYTLNIKNYFKKTKL